MLCKMNSSKHDKVSETNVRVHFYECLRHKIDKDELSKEYGINVEYPLESTSGFFNKV